MTEIMEQTQADVLAKLNEIDKILNPMLATKLNKDWRCDGFESVVNMKADSSLPIIVNIYINHTKIVDTYDENYAFAIDGLYVAVDWLEGLGLLDGTVDVRVREDMDNLTQF